jgi:hypothetical protein
MGADSAARTPAGLKLPRPRVSLTGIAAALFLIAFGAVAALTIRHFWPANRSTDIFSVPATRRPPAEYLYLDSTRIATYLSQLENGLSQSELETLSNSTSFNVSGGGKGLQAGGTVQSTRSLQATVTPTAASLFYRLEGRLSERDWLDSDNAASDFKHFEAPLLGPDAAQEGQFVELKNCLLTLPAFARVYPKLKPTTPALPLSLRIDDNHAQHFDLLFPVDYTALANEPSLFGTRLTVVGKLIRKVSPGRSYTDVVTKTAFSHALATHGALLTTLRLPSETLLRQFAAAVRVRGPGAVILPIAILK